MPQIDILMATYNGGEYIAAQIRSLQNQTFSDWHLIVHDDGSTDGTLEIINDFCKIDDRIEVIDDGKSFHGPAGNFIHLMKSSVAPYMVFCDQDDIWLEDKLQKLYDTMLQVDNGMPQMVYCNAYVYDTMQNDISGHAVLWQPADLHEALFANAGVQGCSIMINSALRDVCNKVPNYVTMHDHFVTLAALTFGKITYVNQRLMLYRRHSLAVTGATYKNFMERITHFFNSDKTVLEKSHVRAIESFYECFEPDMPMDKKAIFTDFFRFLKEGKIRNLLHAFKGGYRLFGSQCILMFKILVRKMV